MLLALTSPSSAPPKAKRAVLAATAGSAASSLRLQRVGGQVLTRSLRSNTKPQLVGAGGAPAVGELVMEPRPPGGRAPCPAAGVRQPLGVSWAEQLLPQLPAGMSSLRRSCRFLSCTSEPSFAAPHHAGPLTCRLQVPQRRAPTPPMLPQPYPWALPRAGRCSQPLVLCRVSSPWQ